MIHAIAVPHPNCVIQECKVSCSGFATKGLSPGLVVIYSADRVKSRVFCEST
jgi:hypothetical protein